MKRIALILTLCVTAAVSHAQIVCDGVTYFCMENGTISTCSGNLVDDGAGSPYSDTPYTMTLCPDTPGDVIQLDFVAFGLQTSPNPNNSDQFYIYDGDSDDASSLGSYSGTDLQNHQVTGTVLNETGCITIVFDPNGLPNAGSPGWQASISCVTPCAPPVVGAAITSPAPVDPALQTVNICLGESVSFANSGSTAQPGFSIISYAWDFDDGSTGTGTSVTHSFDAPGEYIVTLTIQDNNECENLNVVPLQVLVSTYPTFSGMTDLATCLGETVIGNVEVGDDNALPENGEIGGGVDGTTWTALPPQVVSGETYLADGAGFSYSTSLVFDFFEADATLETCDDFGSVFVNMEHSYMGDLGMYITCPNGTVVYLLNFPNSGGTLFLGEAIDIDDPDEVGVGYDYTWTADATETFSDWAGSNTINYGDALPAGEYASEGNLCDLVGCPLNGEWTFSVTDNQGIDDGHIFYWGLQFNPELYPGVTTFTPTIGAGADSSYWVTSGAQWITDITPDGDAITITPESAGVFNYTYVVINNFGCQFDTTIQVTITESPTVSAGPDQLFSCGEVTLDGSLNGEAPIACSQCGDLTYCYSGGEYINLTYCPDIPGAGVVTVNFLSGSTEEWQDYLSVYDGPDTWPSPYIGGYTGDLTGLSWTSTDESGCLTLNFSDWNGINTCADGFTEEWNYNVSVTSVTAANFVWDWNPGTYLNSTSIQDPTVLTLPATTTFHLDGYPAGHPACGSSDEVVVSIDPLGDPGLDTDITICSTDAPFFMTDELDGTPVSTGVWYDPLDNVIADGMFNPMVNLPGNYTYSVDMVNCEAHAILNIMMAGPTVIQVPNDTIVCTLGSVNLNMLDLDNGQEPFNYKWTYNDVQVSSVTNDTYAPDSSGTACLIVEDACGYIVTQCFNVELLPAIDVVFTADTTAACWPGVFNLVNLVDDELFTSSKWEISDGTILTNTNGFTQSFDEPGNYDVTLTLSNELGCAYSATYPSYLASFTPPTANYYATPQPTDATQTEITFENISVGDITNYLWVFGDSLGYSAQAEPVYEFPIGVGGEYPVSLTVTDIHNCKDVIEAIVDINDIFTTFIPNSFTPNNDGVNDVFYVYGGDIDNSRFSFQVFDRWGDMVFETNDMNIPWTGEVHGGEYYAPNGTYNWRALIVSQSTGERSELTGYINLFR